MPYTRFYHKHHDHHHDHNEIHDEHINQTHAHAKHAKTYHSFYVYSVVLSQTLGTMLFYVTASFNPVQNFVKYHAFDHVVEKMLLTLITSFLPLGAAFGALASGKMAARFGRRNPMLAIDSFAILGAVFTVLPNPIVLLIGRLIQGFCAGADSSLVPLYIREVSPTEISGKLGTFNQFSLTFGQLLPNLIGLGMPLGNGDSDPDNKLYLVILGMAGVMPLLRIILTLIFFNHETPKYLLSINKEEETKALLRRIYVEERVEKELENLKIQKEKLARAPKVTLREIFSKRYRLRLLMGIVVACGQRIVGVNALTFYANTIFSVGSAKGTRKPQIYTCIVFAMATIGAFCSNSFIERFGRRFLLISGSAFCGVTIGAFGILSLVDDASPASKWLMWLYMLGYGLTIGPVSWIYIADILPEVGISIATLCLWLVIFGIGIIFPYVPVSGMGYTFIFFAVCSLLCMTHHIFLVKETKGKTRPEIDAMFENTKKAVPSDNEKAKVPLSLHTEESTGLKTTSEAVRLKSEGEAVRLKSESEADHDNHDKVLLELGTLDKNINRA